MDTENPKCEDSTIIVLGNTHAMQLSCKCGAPISRIPIETIDGQKIGEIARSKCPACGEESGFDLGGDKEGRDGPDKLSELRKFLTEDLRQDLMRIQEQLRLAGRKTATEKYEFETKSQD
jgi:hypothetical protein